jgi:hypothetical protein
MELVNEFIGCTGASIEIAENMLAISDYDLTTAIDLYFASQNDTSQTSQYKEVESFNYYKQNDEEEKIRAPISVKRQKLINIDVPTHNTTTSKYKHEMKVVSANTSSITRKGYINL